ncbi:MAG: hypothetical protein CM15mV41_0170 [Caudoviricetes sp.]|nr:MAG: hypothetical protein CM15mV41_0170 [Caudoviricetes sp.]
MIYSQENTLVVFPSQIKHVGHACTDAANRIVLNLNYITFPMNERDKEIQTQIYIGNFVHYWMEQHHLQPLLILEGRMEATRHPVKRINNDKGLSKRWRLTLKKLQNKERFSCIFESVIERIENLLMLKCKKSMTVMDLNGENLSKQTAALKKFLGSNKDLSIPEIKESCLISKTSPRKNVVCQ